MGIRARTAIYVAFTMLVLTAVMMFAARTIITRSYADLEHKDIEKSVHLTINMVEAKSPPLASNAVSYAAWDDTYQFMKDHNRAYRETNLTGDGIAGLNVDFMILLDSNGHVVGSSVLDEERASAVPMPLDFRNFLANNPTLFRFASNVDTVNGLLILPRGPALIGAAPIVTSQSKGEPRGTVLVGSFLSHGEISQLASAQHIDVSLSDPTSSSATMDIPEKPLSTSDARESSVDIRPINNDIIAGYATLKDIRGNPALVLTVKSPRAIKAEGRRVLTYALIGLLVFVGVSIAVLILVLDRTVLSRLANLTHRVTKVGEDEATASLIPVEGRDEIAQLTTSINGMLESIDRSRKDLVVMATHDSLTHAFNRRRFEDELMRELAEQRRLGTGGALLWFDLDAFKDINDTYGHGVGDEVLVAFTDTLRSEMRMYSSLARLGGDEFAMIIPGADESEALATAQRLIDLFAEREYKLSGHVLRIRTSIGLATYPRDGNTVEELLAHADMALYHSKKTGRGRVSSFAATKHALPN